LFSEKLNYKTSVHQLLNLVRFSRMKMSQKMNECTKNESGMFNASCVKKFVPNQSGESVS